MIRLMSEDFNKALKATGYITVLPSKKLNFSYQACQNEGWDINNISDICIETPYKIIYTGKEFAETQHLFDFVLTLTNKFMLAKDIDISRESILADVKNKKYLKSLTYSWLYLSIEFLEHFGSKRKKSKMSIKCNLPGIANILLERNYRRIHKDDNKKLVYSDVFDEVRDFSGFVAIKDLGKI